MNAMSKIDAETSTAIPALGAVPRKYDTILATIGNTPIVRINKLAPPHVKLYAKLEAFNPMASVKDRLAIGIIEDAERTGALKSGQTVIEATSGNTGIGLAMVCAQKGYPLVVTMAENFSVERRQLMRFLGARVVLTPAAEKGSGMLAKAQELAEKHGWFLCRQFENEANADIHSRTTAREILHAFEGEPLDYFVTGFGTGGTLKGIARVLKAERGDTRVVACEPDNAQVLGSGIPQPRGTDGTAMPSHPNFRPHLMQGWSPDFISKLTEDAAALDLIDDFTPVSGADALRLSRELAIKEGILTGITGGATLAAALKVCETAEPGSTVLCILPDTGERYLSTPLFEDIAKDMTAEEVEISNSTAGYQFGSGGTPTPKKDTPKEEKPVVTERAHDFVESVVNDAQQPVVMFALEWCEFCWSARKLFAKLGVAFKSVDLDSVAFQEDDFGGQIRAALNVKTDIKTIPQIFVGGQLIGGCTELFDSYKSGELSSLFEQAGIGYDTSCQLDPYGLLPKWIQPRQPQKAEEPAADSIVSAFPNAP